MYRNLVFIVFHLLLASTVAAQSPVKTAFVVGLSDYFHHSMESLKYGVKDVQDLETELKRLGFTVTPLTGKSAKRAAVNQNLTDWLKKTEQLSKEDITLVFLSGHGQQLLAMDVKKDANGAPMVDANGKPVLEEQEVPFFCPYDAIAFDSKKDSIKGKTVQELEKQLNLISINRIIDEIVGHSNSLSNLIIVDACRNNPAKGKGVDGSDMRNFPSRISILFGAGSGQRSWESTDESVRNGVFTHYMLQGLRGDAADRQGRISWLRLVDYVTIEVPEKGWKIAGNQERYQSPQLLVNNLRQSIILGSGVKVPPVNTTAESRADLKNKQSGMTEKASANGSGSKTKPPISMTPDLAQPQRYALLVAVTRYGDDKLNTPPLRYPEDDATALAQRLKAGGYEVDLLLGDNATHDEIQGRLDGLELKGNAEGAIVVGFFGRGVDYSGELKAKFCPFDTKMRNARDKDGRQLYDVGGEVLMEPEPNSMIGVSSIFEAFSVCKSGNRLLIADCRSLYPTGRAFGTSINLDDMPSETAAIFAYTDGDEYHENDDWGHGAMTKCLLKLIPEGDQSTVGSIGEKLIANVSALVSNEVVGKKQTVRYLTTGVVRLKLSDSREYKRDK